MQIGQAVAGSDKKQEKTPKLDRDVTELVSLTNHSIFTFKTSPTKGRQNNFQKDKQTN